jgi:hypothetical protein
MRRLNINRHDFRMVHEIAGNRPFFAENTSMARANK